MTGNKKINGFLLSFLIGGTVGGVLALLFAPKSGKSLRNDISGKTGELIEEARKKANNTWSAAREKAESTFESANDFLNTSTATIARKAERIKDAVKPEVNALYEEIKPGRQSKNSQGTKESKSISDITAGDQSSSYDKAAFAKDAENTM
jgi:gas vesicle protein